VRVLGLPGRPGRDLAEVAQVLVLVGAQAQDAGQRVHHGRARIGLLAALEPGVVVDADAGQDGDLLAPQARGAPDAHSGGEADVLGLDRRAPRFQEDPQLTAVRHTASVERPREV
jgi:hypothetical protein